MMSDNITVDLYYVPVYTIQQSISHNGYVYLLSNTHVCILHSSPANGIHVPIHISILEDVGRSY